MNKLTYKQINKIANEYGDAFYVFDEKVLSTNYNELLKAFSSIYPKMNIAYSYKTNYTPYICKKINECGGYAEIVSDMEYELAKRIGVNANKIIFNGPCKEKQAYEELVLNGGYVNLDSQRDFEILKDIQIKHAQKALNIGIRCNFDVEDGVVSRFGIDIDSKLFQEIICFINKSPNIKLRNLQCHFANRALKYWKNRAPKIFEIIAKYDLKDVSQIDLGGGLYGKMPPSLKGQFHDQIPSYSDYAKIVATQFAEHYKNCEDKLKPELVIEPGTAIVADVMKFVARVLDIKNIRGKNIATLLGSIYNINPTLNTKNPPIEILYDESSDHQQYADLDFGGYTCIESDYLYRHYSGKLAVNDYVVFSNVGSYSVVLKPPFILPNFPMLAISNDKQVKLIKKRETFDDVFHTFRF